MGRNWRLFAAVATLTGTVMGAGFLGIPYVVAKSGFLIGVIEIVFIGLILLLCKLYMGEILLRTKKTHQLPGLAKLYLGKWGYKLMFFSMFFGMYFTLVAYLIAEGESLSFIFTGTINYSLYFAVGFWTLLSYFVYQGMRALKKGESIGLILVFSIFSLIVILFSGEVQIENLMSINFNNVFLPIGVVLFAFLGFSAIPEVKRELRGENSLMRKVIAIGEIIPIILYVIFTLIVVGFSGSSTPEIATFSLGKFFVLLGILTVFTAFFAVSLALRDMYHFDFGYSKIKSWFLASFIPLVLFLIFHFFSIGGFVRIIGIVGAVAGGLSAILILLMVNNAKKLGKRKPEYSMKLPRKLLWILILFFIIGILAELLF